MAAYATPIAVVELCFLKVHRRQSTGLDWTNPRAIDLTRIRLKFIGLSASVAAVVLAHWLFGFYQSADLEMPKLALALALPILVPVSLVYIALVDRVMVSPEDGYWQVGRLLSGRPADRNALRDHALGWAIKGFFWPIMFTYLVTTIARLQAEPFIGSHIDATLWLARLAVILDLTVACVGYLCTLRIFDARIRSANPYLVGWLATLSCYAPFNRLVFGVIASSTDRLDWHQWMRGMDWISFPWAAMILLSFAIWVWANACFGLRFSNLTNRGILTEGPFRFTKHPSYVSKNIFFWLTQVPFISAAGPLAAFKACVLMAVLSATYFARARYEERHLSEDPAYVAYAAYIERHGMFRRLGHWIPAIRFRLPQAAAGKA
jgi:protein-S-isoprenylcysteine O-methyltransferase Ste14